MPNPPKPVEVKRRTGNPGKRALPDRSKVVALPAADGIPDPLRPLQREGRRTWDRVWGNGAVWLSPATDIELVPLNLAGLDEDDEEAPEPEENTRYHRYQVKLLEQDLDHRSAPVRMLLRAGVAQGIEFVDEHHARGFLSRFREEFANARGASTDEKFHKLRCSDWKESDASFAGDRSSEQGFPRPRRSN